jgi:hypothetical protein
MSIYSVTISFVNHRRDINVSDAFHIQLLIYIDSNIDFSDTTTRSKIRTLTSDSLIHVK